MLFVIDTVHIDGLLLEVKKYFRNCNSIWKKNAGRKKNERDKKNYSENKERNGPSGSCRRTKSAFKMRVFNKSKDPATKETINQVSLSIQNKAAKLLLSVAKTPQLSF